MKVSQESQNFLENLRLYLFSSGKSEKDIEDIIGELEDHLHEAEKKGKNVEDITGQTPKQYMEQLANELPIDVKGLLKYIPVIMLGGFSYVVIGDAIPEGLEYSLLELIGYPIIFILFLLITATAFKYVASTKISKTKEWLIFAIIGFTPISLFVALIYLNRFYETPSVQFGTAGNIIAVTFALMVFIAISIWSKTWISIILAIILFLPEILINSTNFQESTKLIVTGILVPVLVGIYMFIIIVKEKKTEKKSDLKNL